VTERGDAAGLRQQLRDGLAAQLIPAGWYPVLCNDDHSMTLAAFVRPLSDDFTATAEYTRALSTPDRPPVLVTQPMLGVAYEPLRGLWPLLGDSLRIAALTTLPETAGGMEVHTQDDVAPVAKQLAGLALERAVAFAEGYTSVDALLEAYHDDESEGSNQVVPALLAAAGRFEEARNELARYRPAVNVPEAKRRERRFVYQMTRWIDSGGDSSLLPSAPPPHRYARSERRSVTETWHEIRARNAAVEALKRAGAGHDRAELRSMLKSELVERGVGMDPLRIEQAIDQLWISHGERAREGAKALKTVGRIGLAVANAIRTHELPELPDMSVPEWLEPPPQAVYAVPRRDDPGHQWTAVHLDAGNTDWLQSVYAAVPRFVEIVESATLDAWLDWEHPQDRSGPLQVHLGERRVGVLDEEATAVYRDVADAAAQREELPCVEARLTPIRAEDNYLLEVALPVPRAEAC
jgi:hypothetical protein